MRFIYFLRTRTAYVVLVLMSIACVGALFIAGRMTVVAYKKQNQEINSPNVANSTKIENTKSKMPNLKAINEIALYYNGTRIDGLMAFSTSKGELLFPIDDLFKYIGIDYTYHSSDGIFEANVNDCKIAIKVWSDTFKVNNTEYLLPYAIVLSNDRIMVPLDVLNKINGFSVSGYPYLSTAYVNYNSDYLSSSYKKVYYAAQCNETMGIYNIYGDSFYNTVDVENSSDFAYSPAREAVLYNKNQSSSLLYKSLNFAPVELNLGGSGQWTEDMRSVYLPLNNFKHLKIYNPDNGKIIELENVRDVITSNDDFRSFSSGTLRLVSYWSYDKTTRISVRNTKTDEVCTVLYSRNKPFIVARAWMSPTGANMAYINDGEYRVTAYDGNHDRALDGVIAINWVTDNLLMIYRNDQWHVYNVLKGAVEKGRDNDIGFLGLTEDEGVLFKESKAIYKSIDGKTSKVLDIDTSNHSTDNVNLTSVVAAPGLNTIIAADAQNNSVYLINNSMLTKIGEYTSLLKSYKENRLTEDLSRSVKISPDGKTFTLMQVDKDAVKIKIMAIDGSWSKELRLDSNIYLKSQFSIGDLNYIDNNKLVFNNQNSIWLIDFKKNEPQITQHLKYNTKILGVMVK